MFADAIEKDVFLIGIITVISGCLPNIQESTLTNGFCPLCVHYHRLAPVRKTEMGKYFGLKIHKTMVQQSIREEAYEQEMENYNNLNKNQRQGVERPRDKTEKCFTFRPIAVHLHLFRHCLTTILKASFSN